MIFHRLGWKVIDFLPHGEIFELILDEHICSQKCSGTCLAGNMNVVESIGDQYINVKRADEMYCPNIINNIMKNGFDDELFPIMVVYNSKCGHYSVADGQHRICAAAKANIPITIYLKEQNDYECRVCALKKHSLKFRINAKFEENRIQLYSL